MLNRNPAPALMLKYLGRYVSTYREDFPSLSFGLCGGQDD
jgi:hypothetical protein